MRSRTVVVALIVYGIVAFIVFDSQENLSCTWIDMYSRNPYGVGHLLQKWWQRKDQGTLISCLELQERQIK